MICVLLVDDDQELTEMLSQYLAREGFEATAVHTGEEGEVEALSGRYSIVVLDVMLPQRSGIEVLRRIRAVSQVPVVLLTARGDNIDRITGLELGADDYVPKPSSPGELVARLRAIMRRVQPVGQPTEVIKSGARVLWPGKRQALLAGDRSFIGRLRNRRPRDQAPVAVIDADVFIRRTFPDREELACGVDPELFQQPGFRRQNRFHMGVAGAKAAQLKHADPDEKRQGSRQPEGQEQFPEQQAGPGHSAINR